MGYRGILYTIFIMFLEIYIDFKVKKTIKNNNK